MSYPDATQEAGHQRLAEGLPSRLDLRDLEVADNGTPVIEEDTTPEQHLPEVL